MKNFFLTLFCSVINITISMAQMGINTNGASPNTSAMLDVSSTTKGLLPPRMSSVQRIAIASPAEGLLVYDTNTQSYWFRQLSAWTELPKAGSTANYWNLSGTAGNEIQNINSGGFWSAHPTGVLSFATDENYPPTAPVSGAGTRLMWIPGRSAFRVGTIGYTNNQWDAANIGIFSVAMGYNTLSSGVYSTAFGQNTQATGNTSTAFGDNCVAMADYSTCFGKNSHTFGYAAFSTGSNASANSSYSVAMGQGTNSNGLASTAIGILNNANGNVSVALGENNTSNGVASLVTGYSNIVNSNHSVGLGLYNNDYYSLGSVDENRFLLTIGNGSENGRRNCFEIRQTGTVQINHYAPTTNNPDRYGLRIKRDVATGSQFWTLSHPTSENLDFHYGASGAFKAYVRQSDGAWVQSSDIRLKEQIKPIESVLEKVAKLKVSHYFYKTDSLHVNQQMGLIAQEVLPIFPEFVTKNGEYYGINYGGLSVVAIKAIQELKDENQQLKATIKQYHHQEQLLKGLKSEIDLIKAQLSNNLK